MFPSFANDLPRSFAVCPGLVCTHQGVDHYGVVVGCPGRSFQGIDQHQSSNNLLLIQMDLVRCDMTWVYESTKEWNTRLFIFFGSRHVRVALLSCGEGMCLRHKKLQRFRTQNRSTQRIHGIHIICVIKYIDIYIYSISLYICMPGLDKAGKP